MPPIISHKIALVLWFSVGDLKLEPVFEHEKCVQKYSMGVGWKLMVWRPIWLLLRPLPWPCIMGSYMLLLYLLVLLVLSCDWRLLTVLMIFWSSVGWEYTAFASWLLWDVLCYARMRWFPNSVKDYYSRVWCSVIAAKTCYTILDCCFLYPRDALFWVGHVLLYAV